MAKPSDIVILTVALDIASRERAHLSQLLHTGGPQSTSEWRCYFLDKAAAEAEGYPKYFKREKPADDPTSPPANGGEE